jgi:hypothetical protein
MANGDGIAMVFQIRGDSSQLGPDLAKASPIIRAETAKISNAATNDLRQLDSYAQQITNFAKSSSQSLTQFSSSAITQSGLLKKDIADVSKAVSGLGLGIGNLVSPLTLATAAAGGLIALLISSAHDREKIIQDTIEYDSKIHDLSIKTGLAAETLSGLNEQAKESGTSIDALAKGVFLLQKNVESGGPKVDALAKSFGITKENVGDADATLRRFFEGISKLPTEAERNAAGARLMGKSYQELSVLLADTHGDIDAVIAKAKEMGLVLSGESAAAADRLGDAFARLKTRKQGLDREFGEKQFSEVRVGLDIFTASLNRNKEMLDRWGDSAASAGLRGLALKGVLGLIGITAQDIGKAHIQNYAEMISSITDDVLAGASTKSGSLPSLTKSPRVKKPQDDEGRAQLQALDESNRAIVEKMRAANDAIKEEYDKGAKDRDDFYDEARTRLASATLDELANIEQQKFIALARIKDKTKLDDELTKLDNTATKIKDEAAKEKRRLDAQQDKDELDAKIAQLERNNAAQSFYEEKQLQDTEEAFKRGLKFEDDVEQVRYENQQARLGREKEILEERRKAYGEYAEQYKAITDQLEQNDAERLRSAELHAKRMSDIWVRIGASDRDSQFQDVAKRAGGEDIGAQPFGGDPYFGLGKPPNFKPHMDAIGALRDFATDAWGGITQGFGSMIESFLIGGNQANVSFGKMAKAAIASVTAQAAVHALFEVGMALASMWLNPAEAATHWLAAETFGLVAGVGAAVALAIPGGGNSAAASAGSTTPSTNRSNTSSSNQPTPIAANRGRSEPQYIIIEKRTVLEPPPGWVVREVVSDYRGSGKTKDIMGHFMGLPGYAG